MLRDALQFFRLAVDRQPLERMLLEHAEQVGQARRMIEMGVRQKEIGLVGLQISPQAKHARPRVQHDAALRQQQTRRLPPLGRMIAARAEEKEFHGRKSALRMAVFQPPELPTFKCRRPA